MAQEQQRKDNPQSDGVAQQPGNKSESSGSSGTGGRHDKNEQNSSSGAMSGQGTFGSGANGPGMDQSSPKGSQAREGEREQNDQRLEKGLGKNFPDGPADPESAQNSFI
jgi:hypothetical protein